MKHIFELCAFADEADLQIEEQVKALSANGIKYLEIRGVNGKNISEVTADEAKNVGRMLADSGHEVWSIGSPTGKMKITEDFMPHFDSFKHMLELADILGTKHYRLFSFFGVREAGGRARDLAMEYLQRFIDEAKGSEIILCHENEKEIYGEMAKECLEIHKTFPEIKAIFDPANFIQAEQDTKEAWALLHPYVEYMHIKDSTRNKKIVPAGCGDGNLAYLINEFGKGGGKVLSIEPHLTVFKGFEALENKNDLKNIFTYPSSREAFDAAASALKKIIERTET